MGSGAGHNAFYLKQWYDLTLTDLSEQMLNESRRLNPECLHACGDMRSLQMAASFNIVFIHDAIMCMLTDSDLGQVIQNAYRHLVTGGLLLVAPDDVAETFRPSTDHGGNDGEGQSLRYLEWVTGPEENGTFRADYLVAIRNGNQPLQVYHDDHQFGLFSVEKWLQLFSEAGFHTTVLHNPFGRINFVGIK